MLCWLVGVPHPRVYIRTHKNVRTLQILYSMSEFAGLRKRNLARISKSTQKRRWAESFAGCCQWALLDVQIMILLFPFTVHKYIYPPVSKMHAGFFSWFRNPPNPNMDCRIYNVRAYVIILVRAYTRGRGLGTHRQRASTTFVTRNCFLYSWRDSNLGHLDLECDALPIEPPRHPCESLPPCQVWMP